MFVAISCMHDVCIVNKTEYFKNLTIKGACSLNCKHATPTSNGACTYT